MTFQFTSKKKYFRRRVSKSLFLNRKFTEIESNQIKDMKGLVEFINESKRPKYVIKFYVKGVGNDMRYSDNWQKDVAKEPISKAEYWDVSDNTKWNFSEPNACVAWHGKDSFWGTVVKDSENPENAPSWRTIIKGRDLDRIKSLEK